MKSLVLSLFFLGYINVDQLVVGLDIVSAVERVDIEQVIQDISRCNPHLKSIVGDRRFRNFLREWLGPMLISLAWAESKFRFKRGLYNEDDIGYFQINREYWSVRNVRRYLCYYISTEKVYYDPYIGAQVGARILAYNIAQYIRANGYGHTVWKYALSYRNLKGVHPKSYVRDVQKILFKYDASRRK